MADAQKPATKGQLYLKVLAARGVTAKDSGGTSDVYCQVYLDKEKILKTEVLKKTVDPVFENEKGKLLNLTEPNEEIRVVVKDANFLLPDAFLGQVTFALNALADGIPRDDWYSLESRPGKKDKVQGELHLQIIYTERPDGSINNDDFATPIQVLLKKGKIQQFKNLLQKGTDAIEKADKEENRPLHVACQLDNAEAVQLLLSKNADVKAKNAKGQTPLHCAAEKSLASIAPLIEAKADLESKDKEGSRALHTAAAHNNGKACALLIEKGASLNAQDEKGNTPLQVAIITQSLEAVKVLAAQKKVDIYKRNKTDQHAAHLALKAGGDIKRSFMDAVHVEDEREFDIVDSGWKKRHRIEGENVTPDFQKSSQFVVTTANKCEVKIICHYIGNGSTEAAVLGNKVGFCVVTTTEGKHAEMSYQTNCVGYGGQDPLTISFGPSTMYAILPYSAEAEAKGKFSLLVFTKEKEELSISPLKPWKCVASKKGEWKGDSAAGCNKENNPWRKNPHFLLRLPKDKKEVQVYILLEQQKSNLDIIPFQVHPYAFHIGYYVYDKDVEDIIDRSVWQNAREVYKHFKFDPSKHRDHELVIVPTTVKSGQETAFTISVYADEEVELEKFTPPKIIDVAS